MSNCTTILANPDISGVGIRVNLYIATILVSLIPEIPLTASLVAVLRVNAGISGVSLLLTAIVHTVKRQLSLYHAIFIVHMLYFTGIAVAPSGSYRSSGTTFAIRTVIMLLLTYGSMCLFAGWAFYVWATAPTFGDSPECNDQIKYIFFFFSIRATVDWLRKLWMALLGLTLVTLFLLPLCGVVCCCLSCCSRRGRHDSDSGGGSVDESKEFNLCAPIPIIFGVVMLELYVKRNAHLLSDVGEQQWTFGQIMAILQTFTVLSEIFRFLTSLCSMAQDDD